MADRGKARPVSGEIMAGMSQDPTAGRRARETADDIVDAEYETVASAGRREPSAPRPPLSIGSAASPLAGMEMLRRPKSPAVRPGPARGGPFFWIFGLGLAAAAFWVSGGHALVRNAPFLTHPMPERALRMSGVTSRVDVSGLRPVLFVDGEAANDGRVGEVLPPFDILVTGNDGLVTRYRLGTSGRSLPPGETFAFSSRLDVPKNGVKTVSVTFGE